MISAVNPLQLLNGNKVFFLLFGGILLLISCGSPRKVSTPPSPPPLRVEEDEVAVLDTLSWELISPDDQPPFTYPENSPFRDRIVVGLPTPKFKSEYQILLVLPMEDWPTGYEIDELLEEIGELLEEEPEESIRLSDYINEDMIGFLNGLEYSLRKEPDLPLKIRLEVVAGGVDQTEQLKKSLLNIKITPDIILGGSSRNDLEILSEFTAEKNAVLLSPWFAGNFIPANGSQVVSFQPDLMAHFEKVMERLSTMKMEDNFYIIYSQRERARVDQFKNLFSDFFPDRNFGEIYFESDEDILEFDFEEFFNDDSKTWFFVPMTRNHPFIHPILRAIDLTKPSSSYEVIGITLWDRDIHLEFHQKLNLVNASANLPVSGKSTYRSFHYSFFNNMGYIGGLNEYEGKVTGDFIIRNLLNYGHQFPYYLPYSAVEDNYFRWQFGDLKPDAPKPTFGDIPLNLRNKGIYLLTFEDGKFKLME